MWVRVWRSGFGAATIVAAALAVFLICAKPCGCAGGAWIDGNARAAARATEQPELKLGCFAEMDYGVGHPDRDPNQLFVVLGLGFRILCNASRPLRDGEAVQVYVDPLSDEIVETAGDMYGIPKIIDEWYVDSRIIYTYNVSIGSLEEAPFYGDDGLLDVGVVSPKGPFSISTNESSRAHMGRYTWSAISGDGKELARQSIGVHVARPPTSVKAVSKNFFLDAEDPPAVSVVAEGGYPPSALAGRWFPHGLGAEGNSNFITSVRHVSGSSGGVDVKWNLIYRGKSTDAAARIPDSITFNLTWVPPDGFDLLFPDNVTYFVTILPKVLERPIVQTRFFSPDYVVCRASNVLCDTGSLEWAVGNELVTSVHQTAYIPRHMDKSLCTLVEVMEIPADTSLQKSVVYTCILRGYERHYRWLNSTTVLDNMPTSQGRPVLICLVVIVSLLVLGVVFALQVSLCMRRKR